MAPLREDLEPNKNLTCKNLPPSFAIARDGDFLYNVATMKTLRAVVTAAATAGKAVGHFNVSDSGGLWAVFNAARELGLPVIIGVSEGEREFIGLRQIAALVKSLREEFPAPDGAGPFPIFLNADHTYTVEGVRRAVDAGCDAVIFDGALPAGRQGKLPLAENIKLTKECVAYAREKNPEILVEGELGDIGASSKILDEAPRDATGASVTAALTDPAAAAEFVQATGVDLLAPAVGNFHWMLRGQPDPHLDLARIKAIREAVGIPLVLHGASGNTAADVAGAIDAGCAIVHVNTELRLAYRDALKLSLQAEPDEVAPYKFLKPALAAMQKVAMEKLRLFSKT